LNTVDAILLALLLVAAIDGLRRGFILGVLDFVALAASLGLALTYHRPLAAFLVDGVNIQVGIASAVALAGIFVAAGLLFALLGALLTHYIEIADWLTGVGTLNTLAGIIPGLVKGSIVAIIAIHAGLLLPQSFPLSADLRSSDVARRVDGAFNLAAPFVMGPLDQIASEAPQFVPLIQPGERKELEIPKGAATTIDPSSEITMLRLLNQERAIAGLPLLVSDDVLRSVARAHSEEMFQLGYFSHDSPLGGTPADRVRRAGARYTVVAENLAYAPTVEVAHRSLMASSEHRRNILSPELKRVGIGVAQSGVWGRMFTQSFTD
jgi:uncharacterized protein YkwD/uncharacterized membrane protein required for colicin V production